MRVLLSILGLFLVTSCQAQTDLPREMPLDISFSFIQTGGMMRAHRRINVTASTIEFDELKGNGSSQLKWTKDISAEHAKKLYAAFVANSFDTIRNDVRTERVHDAGSEYISLSLGVGKTFNAVYGKNSPLSGNNLKRYTAVRDAINALLAKYQDGVSSEAEIDEEYIQGKWRAAGESPGRHTWFLE